MKKTIPFVLFALSAIAAHAAETRFSMTFADYADGEALSEKGAVGGSWQVSESLVLTNATYGSHKGMSFAEATRGDVTFVAADTPEGDVERYDFDFCVDALSPLGMSDAEDLAAFTVADNGSGVAVPMVWGDGKWNVMTAPDGIDLAVGNWLCMRVEIRRYGDAASVSYLMKAGTDYVRLVTAGGRAWFGAGGETSSARRVEFAGPGCVSDFSGTDEASGYVPTNYYWIGGASGNWEDAANWSLAPGGAAAATAPSSVGDLAHVDGTVALTLDGVTANVKDLLVRITDGGNVVVGGTVTPVFDLDVSRPRAGKALTAAASDTFCGLGSDLTYAWSLAPYTKEYDASPVATTLSYKPTAADYEHWLRFVAADASGNEVYAKEFYFSALPVCYLTTDDGTMPTAAKEEHTGTLRIQGNDDWSAQYGYDGNDAITVKVRGNSTRNYPKKPYKIKLDKKTNLFKFGKNKHWVLLANYNDMSMMRNKDAYDFANAIGSLGMDSTWVNCVFNGDYIGTYELGEHIRIDSNRVNIYDWEDKAGDYGATEEDFSAIDEALETDSASVDISGGYLFEFSEEYDALSQFTTKSGKLQMRTMLNKPEYLYTSTNMMAWCKNFLQNYWDACTSAGRVSGEGKHYSEYCDVDSMVNFFLVNELFGNYDAYKKSRYAYIDRGGKLVWGPVWDFDWGGASIVVGNMPQIWACGKDRTNDNDGKAKIYSMFKEWASDAYFCRKLYKRYWEIRAAYGEIFKDDGLIDRQAAILKGSCEVNDARWPRDRDFATDVAMWKGYLAAHAAWLDEQFASVGTLIDSLKCDIQSNQSTYDANETVGDTVDSSGETVPAVPADWVREALEGAETSWGWAKAADLAVALTNVPSAWGKQAPLWKDYVAGTDPDPASTNATFRVTSFAIGDDGLPVIEFLPDLGAARKYTVEGRESLTTGTWHEAAEGDTFFRIKVEMK